MGFLVNPFVFGAGAPTAGLELWLKADAIVGLSNGDQINTWPDSSGNGRNGTGVVDTSNKPKWIATGGPDSMPTVLFATNAGVGGYFTLPNFMTGFTQGHVFVVMKKSLKSSGVISLCGPPIGNWGSSGDEYFVFDTDSKIYDGTASSVRKTTVDPGDVTTNWFVYEVRSASGAWSSWKNGVSLFSTGTNTVTYSTSPLVGYSPSSNKVYTGWISEILFYSSVQGAGAITSIYNAIEARYPSISLP